MLHLEDLPPAKAGVPKIDVTFAIDVNGLLEVTAQDRQTGNKKSIRIEDAIWLAPAERSAMTERLARERRNAGERSALLALGRAASAALERALELTRQGDAVAWQRQFAAWQARARPAASGLDRDDEAQLVEMYGMGTIWRCSS